MTTIDAQRPDTKVEVILGVDTHLDFHVAVAIDHLGRRLGESSVPTTAKGYEGLLCWAEGFGPLRCAGIEGTSSYGAWLARYFKAQGIEVLEVERSKRPQPSSRHNLKKSDPSDAESAARAVMADETSGVPKSAEGRVEMIRALRAARRSAMKAKTQAANQLRGLRLTAADELLDHEVDAEIMEPIFAHWARMKDILAAGWRVSDGALQLLHGAIGLALGFHTWRTMTRKQDLTDEQAIDLMVGMARCAAGGVGPG